MDLSSLLRKRGSVKQKLTLLEKYLLSIDKDNVDIEQIKCRITKYETLLNDFEECHEGIISVCRESDIELHNKELEEFEREFFKRIAELKYYIKQEKSSKIDNNILDVEMRSVHRPNVQLPAIPLPRFSGNLEDWIEFKDSFRSLIHNNESLDATSKFHYLRASLENCKIDIIKSIERSSNNYSLAWDMVCQRFDDEDSLINNHIKKLLNQRKIKECSEELKAMNDNILKHLRSLELLGEPVENWDRLLILFLSPKLDDNSLKEWEVQKPRDKRPTMKDFCSFLKLRGNILASLEGTQQFHQPNKNKLKCHALISKNFLCLVCGGNHSIYKCERLLSMSVEDRAQAVKDLRLCFNCLRSGHSSKDCKNRPCIKCNKKHNTLLHRETRNENAQVSRNENPPATSTSLSCSSSNNYALLSTIKVNVRDVSGKLQELRAVLDSGSQSSFITERAYKYLGVAAQNCTFHVSGIGGAISTVTKKCSLTLFSHVNSYKENVTCFVVPKISDDLPNRVCNVSQENVPTNIKLADPKFHEPGQIDLLIGADIFWEVLASGRISMGKNKPILQNTKFGWIVAGNLCNAPPTICNFAKLKTQSIQDELVKFWDIEHFTNNEGNKEFQNGNDNVDFLTSIDRSVTGQFIVKLPLKESVSLLGDSKTQAQKRFFSLERKLKQNDEMYELYRKFMFEYEALGHMKRVDDVKLAQSTQAYYLPHHGVFKQDSLTSKLRVVFDGSSKSSTGWSINDIQYIGPKLHNDLLPILLRFRIHRYVVTSDIEKMFRQILLHKDQRSLQRILWRDSSNDELKTFELQTVTYGMTAAPFLANRCLKQLSYENEKMYPDAAQAIAEDFYVDDFICGSNSIKYLNSLCLRVDEILRKGHFKLRKWVSNCSEVLDGLNAENGDLHMIDVGKYENVKILGVKWLIKSDELTFKLNHKRDSKVLTKRVLLSEIAQIYDPLGLISPCVISAKIILQDLWKRELQWDDPLDKELNIKWEKIRDELEYLLDLRIPRCVTNLNFKNVQIHGFCDASQKAYAACIYVRSIDEHLNIESKLLCSKTRVAPIKLLTIPRLELSSALLLVKLMKFVEKSIKMSLPTFYWSDSQVVLCWLKMKSNNLQQFVRNRVSEIQDNSNINNWGYVNTKENPADLGSRGISAHKLKCSELWWKGPEWLSDHESNWPKPMLSDLDVPELRIDVFTSTLHENCLVTHLLSKHSKLNTLIKIFAFCLRFINNCRKNNEKLTEQFLAPSDIEGARLTLIKLVQRESFSDTITALEKGSNLSKNNKLLKLSPFLDGHGILRVGGRLKWSYSSYEKKHPILLCSKHLFTKRIMESEHLRLLHAGPQLLISTIRQKYWPLAGKTLAKSIVRKCIKCFRFRARPEQATMGNIPASRITPSYPFQHVGVDYGGPMYYKDRKGKGARHLKSYFCVFVCFTTRAIHIEVVTNLSSEAFIAALRRFVARRGLPSDIYSDNGTTFKGANKELLQLLRIAQNTINQKGITWHFIPPAAPHFGGLWEAGVKSIKHHLLRVLGNAVVTLEELMTVIIQIEGILNSRPLYPMSSDPNDLEPLTPSHFLIGRHPDNVADPCLDHLKTNQLSRYQLLQKLHQDFWKRWSREYISQLQVRTKWRNGQPTIQNHDLVLVKEDNTMPGSWQLGRIEQQHPGRDGITRVVSVRTSKGIFKRPIVKICILPKEIV